MKRYLKYPISKVRLQKEKLLTFFIFTVLGLVALQAPINNLAGSRASFTFFDLIAPVSGAFLGGWIGIVAVFIMECVNLAFHGFSNFDKGTFIRLFPILFGVWFFAKRDIKFLIIPIIAIISFNLNPIGRSVWQYSLFWTIPLLVYPIIKKSLVARALASTFVAHSVGGAVWIWAFNLPASVWKGLIPVVALERSIMALGICASFILMTNLVALAKSKRYFSSIKFEKNYLFKFIR